MYLFSMPDPRLSEFPIIASSDWTIYNVWCCGISSKIKGQYNIDIDIWWNWECLEWPRCNFPYHLLTRIGFPNQTTFLISGTGHSAYPWRVNFVSLAPHRIMQSSWLHCSPGTRGYLTLWYYKAYLPQPLVIHSISENNPYVALYGTVCFFFLGYEYM